MSGSIDDRTIDSSDPHHERAAGGPPSPDGAAGGPASGATPSDFATAVPDARGEPSQPPSHAASGRARAAEALIGKTVGRYTILQLLGEGGFGAVYLAEQTEPVRRKVALKLMRAGADREDLVARFEAERQAMAVMNHPGVAKVWDAGALPDGKPFFAMEFVPGKPLDEFCDQERMDLRSRARLFLQVCDAIQHAHTKGVVHRDLKPGNILVLRDADTLHAKVIDFGIAKAVNTTLHSRAFETQFGHFVGTPAYMSPEQADGKADIDTRSDVYTLGVILYELLAGWLPLDQKTLQGVGVSELSRLVREYRPPSPQQRIRQVQRDDIGRALTIAHARSTDPAALARALHGDLERIIFKAIEKDREIRYQGASALGDDLRAWLAGDPVSAGPASTAYRVRKLVAKHKVAVAASAIAIGLIIASAIGMAVLWQDAVKQEHSAKGTLSTFLAALRSANSKGEEKQVSLTIKDLLASVETAVGERLKDDPDVAAELHDTVGQLYLSLMEFDGASRNLTDALALRQDLAASDPNPATELDLARTHKNIARAQYFLKDYAASEASFMRAIATLDALAPQETRERAEAKAMLAAARVKLDKVEQADRDAAEALAMLRDAYSEESEAYGTALFARARQLATLKRTDDAAAMFSRVAEIFSKAVSQDDWRVGRALRELSAIQLARGELAAAMPNLQRSERLMAARFGDTDPLVTGVRFDVADTLLNLRTSPEQAREAIRRAISGRRANGKSLPALADALILSSRIEEWQNDLNAAVKAQQDAVEVERLGTPQGSVRLTKAVGRLAHLLVVQAKHGEAEPLLLEVISSATRDGEPSKAVLDTANADLAAIRPATGPAPAPDASP